MIKSIIIDNIALIEHLEIDFNKSLNILSGETGAGKSIILGAMAAVLGDKISSSIVRSGAKKAYVEAVFDISHIKSKPEIFNELELELDDEEIIIRREITAEGKSKCQLNSRSIILSQVRKVAEYLVDIHSQHDHQSLLNTDNHLILLDRYGELEEDVEAFKKLYHHLKEKKDELVRLKKLEKEKTRILELSKHASEEIDSVSPKIDEEDELEQEIKRINSSQKISESANDAYKELYLKESSSMNTLEKAIDRLKIISGYDNSIDELVNNAEQVYFQLENVKDSIKEYKENIDFSANKIDVLTERLFKIRDLKRKYSCQTIEDLLNYCEDRKKEVEVLENSVKKINNLEEEIEKLEKTATLNAITLSKERQNAAKRLSSLIEAELSALGMEKGKFALDFKYIQDNNGFVKINDKNVKLTPIGIDRVEFLISPNAGEKLMPLKKIASGGELSRIMLALKSVLANLDDIGTMVFDEIDAGIGGETAFNVGRKLKTISTCKQIICITHLAQIASMGTENYKVQKSEVGDRTVTNITKLEKDDLVNEIARMMSGEHLTENSLEHARELIEKGKSS